MTSSVLDRFRGRVAQRVLVKEPLAPYTSFHIGGPAEYFYMPRGEEDLICALRAAKSLGMPATILGNGTNVLISDRGIQGLVVRLVETSLSPVLENGLVLVRAPIPLSVLLNFAMERDLAGLEYLVSIPGTVGGAIYMNAGSFSQAISTHLAYVEVLERDLTYATRRHEDIDFDYRYSEFQEDGAVILGAAFELEHGDGATIRSTAERIRSEKRAKQSWEHPNAGSIFSNPPTTFAGKLIEEAGCKGLQVGQAQVSMKHANFIVNLGGATAQDVVQLMDVVVHRVYARFNIRLSPEIRLLGDFS
ncbi:MAG: UDP-N-acetylmuramate dehydrogenase [Candidatus Cryosericum sp.]|nr:UDP-N-acetylmuramate dehydrogenase [bacterium]